MSQCFGCHELAPEQWDKGSLHAAATTPRPGARRCPPPSSSTTPRSSAITAPVMAERQQAQLCQSCHTQAQCQSCHDVTQDLTVEARRPESMIESGQSSSPRRLHESCTRSRRARSPARAACRADAVETCDACHVARGVSANVANPANPHPPEWVGTNTSSSNFHGTVARRDIVACAGCHEAGPATNCIRCHKVGARTAGIRIRTAGRARAARTRKCAGIAMVERDENGRARRNACARAAGDAVARLRRRGCDGRRTRGSRLPHAA